jgi:hypothetical protein
MSTEKSETALNDPGNLGAFIIDEDTYNIEISAQRYINARQPITTRIVFWMPLIISIISMVFSFVGFSVIPSVKEVPINKNLAWVNNALYVCFGGFILIIIVFCRNIILRSPLVVGKNLAIKKDQGDLILLKVREMNSRIAEIEKILNESNSKLINDTRKSEIDVFHDVVSSVLKNTKTENLGRYIVVDPVTEKYEMGNDCLEIEDKLTEKLKAEGLLSENPKFYMKFIDEDDIEKAKAA